jgi:hypothetical protein
MSESSSVLVTFSALANAAQSIQTTYNNLNSKLDDLQRQLQPIVSTWTGQASENYQVERGPDGPEQRAAGDRQVGRGRARGVHPDRDGERPVLEQLRTSGRPRDLLLGSCA